MRQYLELMEHVLADGVEKRDRTGTGTLSVFGHQMRFDLADGFPLVTTKKLHLKSIVHELLWFLRRRHQRQISQRPRRAHLGRMGRRARRPRPGLWPAMALLAGAGRRHHRPDRQCGRTMIRRNPDSRRLIVTAWNPADVDKMALPPCHCLFQFYVANGRLSCQLYQRSADIFLGVPFNIASYALLTMMVAQVTGLQARRVRPHASATRISISTISSRRTCSCRARRRALPTMRLNPDGEGHLRLPLRGFRARRLRAASAHQGRGGGVSATPPRAHRHRSGRRRRRQRRDRARQRAAVPAELRSQALQALTMGKPVVMGRKTYLSIGKPLPGRTNIVVSRDPSFAPRRASLSRRSLDAALAAARGDALRRGVDEIVVIGGTDIFAQTHAACRPAGDHPCARAAGGRHVLSADRCDAMARGGAQRASGRTAGRGRFQLRHLRTGLNFRTNGKDRVRPARCAAPAACVVRRGRLPYNLTSKTDCRRRRRPPRRDFMPWSNQGGGPWGSGGGRRGLGAPGRNRPDRRRPTSRSCCAAARTSCGACCPAATWAAAALR